MKLRDILGDDDSDRQALESAGTAPAGPDFSELRRAGDRFLAAGDEAISRALSTDSEGFLAANRQQGGQ